MPTSDPAAFMAAYPPGDPYEPSWDEVVRLFEHDPQHAARCAGIEQSVREHGIRKPVTVCRDHCPQPGPHVRNGHHRVIVALRLGVKLPWLYDDLPIRQQPVDLPTPSMYDAQR